MAKVRYQGPSDAVVVSLNGLEVEFVRNHAVEVDDKVAGTPPEPRLAESMAELQVARVGGDHQWQRDLRAEIEGLDYGSGLLAQDIFVAVEPKTPKKEDDK